MSCKLLFVGLDAASPSLIRQWASTGELPVLQRLLDSGSTAQVLNPTGFLSSMSLWPTFFTGLPPAGHGFGAYRQIVANTYTTRPLGPDDIRARCLWKIVSDAGKRVAVIDIPSAPLAQDLNGIQINEWFTHDVFSGINTYPPDLEEKLIAAHGPDPVGHCDCGGRGPTNYKEFVTGLQERIKTRTAFATDLLQHQDWDLFMIGLSESHCVGHQCWHLHDPGHPRFDSESSDGLGDPVKTIYQALDHAIGSLIETAPDAQLFLYSSQGMGACYDANAGLDHILRKLEGGDRAKPGVLGRLVPYLRRRIPAQFHGALEVPALLVKNLSSRSDWAKRKFFAVPSSYGGCGCIRFNLVGREPNGVIAPGEALEREIDTLTKKLYGLREDASGAAVVRQVLRVQDVLGDDIPDDFPDLLVEWADGSPIKAVSSEAFSTAVPIAATNRTGNHRPEGLLIVHGDRVPRHEPLHALDVTRIAPTIAAYFGIDGFGSGQPFMDLKDRP